MIAASLIGAVLWAAVQEPEPSGLVSRLGSGGFDERVAAAEALERLGPQAVPALLVARDGDDPRVGRRADALLDRLAVARLARPTMVRLDFRDRPLVEVLATLNDRHDLRLELSLDPPRPRGLRGLGPQADPARTRQVERQPITLEAPDPLPFWEALRRLGEAGGVRHHPGDRASFEDERPTIRLVASDPPGWTVVRGPFRVHLAQIVYESMADVSGAPTGGPPPGRTLTAELQVFAEPRLFLDPDGLPDVEATDEDGRPLPPPPTEAEPQTPRPPSWGGPGEIPIFEYMVIFGVPDPRPGRLRTLRGTIPVLVSARPGTANRWKSPSTGPSASHAAAGRRRCGSSGSIRPAAPLGSRQRSRRSNRRTGESRPTSPAGRRGADPGRRT